MELGITVDQWVLLKIIEESKSLSQKELAVISLRNPASITRSLDILEKNGFIDRMPIPFNRRQYEITLTAKGSDFVQKNMELIKGLRKRSIKGFTKQELENLTSMLLRIQKNMS